MKLDIKDESQESRQVAAMAYLFCGKHPALRPQHGLVIVFRGCRYSVIIKLPPALALTMALKLPLAVTLTPNSNRISQAWNCTCFLLQIFTLINKYKGKILTR